MEVVSLLVVFPIIAACILLCIRNDKVRSMIARIAALIVAILTILTVYTCFGDGRKTSVMGEEIIGKIMMVIEVLLAIYFVVISVRKKQYFVTLFAVIQTSLLIWFEMTFGEEIQVETMIVFDKLTAIMVLVIGIVGSLICLYTIGYMKTYHEHHKEIKDRTSLFLAIVFLFLSAMFGLVLCNDLVWIYFCWEITSLASFLLIGYTRTKEAQSNSFRALTMNLFGGLGFVVAILILGIQYETLELSTVTQMKPDEILMIPVMLLALAAFTKSAQMPFQSWLLGAMVAPTPSSALLHSATMVKAGVYLLIRLAPLLGATLAGHMVTMIGTITFLMCSLMAIAENDAKKILAYSTIANLGLIVMCAGVGTPQSLWGGMLLIVFHAVSKSLLFLTVGTAEHKIGSRDVEDMDILLGVSRGLTLCMVIGIAGMFLAPFGMLISKWVAMKAFIDSNNILVVVVLAYGSAATLFYWTKWMGKLVTNSHSTVDYRHRIPVEEKVPISILTGLVIMSCFGFPLISKFALVPYLKGVFGTITKDPIGAGDVTLMLIMFSMLVILPIGFIPMFKHDKRRIVPIYMAGENTGDNETFYGMGSSTPKAQMRNWYMEEIFGSKSISLSGTLGSLVILIGFVMLIAWEVIK